MMYSPLLPGVPSFLRREVAEACIEAGSHGRTLALLEVCDTTSPRTMIDIFKTRLGSGDLKRAMDELRRYLDSEWVGSDEYLEVVRMLLGHGLNAESLILRSEIAKRLEDLMSSLMLVTEASSSTTGPTGPGLGGPGYTLPWVRMSASRSSAPGYYWSRPTTRTCCS